LLKLASVTSADLKTSFGHPEKTPKPEATVVMPNKNIWPGVSFVVLGWLLSNQDFWQLLADIPVEGYSLTFRYMYKYVWYLFVRRVDLFMSSANRRAK